MSRFNLKFGMPFPRRLLMPLGTLVAIILFLHVLAPSTLPPVLTPHYPHHEPDASPWSTEKWIPPIFNKNRPDRPQEFDELGQCVFISPFDALSPEEKALAEAMEFETVTPGIVGSKKSADGKQAHPILGLILDGERRWNKLLEGQSKTFEQAVNTYEERWGRPPPKGFDDWWSFALAGDSLLIDEFDAIMEALLPFYGLPVDELKKRNEEAETVIETYTLIVNDSRVVLQWNDDYARDRIWSTRSRADAQINLMEPFIDRLPPFRATFSVHDQPSVHVPFLELKALTEAAKKKQTFDPADKVDTSKVDYTKLCPSTSAVNMGQMDEPSTETFIQQHLKAMNPCDHPSVFDNHGMFLEVHDKDSRPVAHDKLLPFFVLSKTQLHADIPITPVGHEGHVIHAGPDRPWTSKSGKVYWRGLSTGMDHNKGKGKLWRNNHRERLHHLANDKNGTSQTILTAIGKTGFTKTETHSRKKLGDYYMDTKLAGGPWQCSWDDGTCNEMGQEIDFAEKDPVDASLKYKYILDTDGNAWSSRFPRLLSSLNMVIKATVFPEWNSHHLPEWFAYVPTKIDYSDLYSIIAFFRGGLKGKGSHDEVARRIARNGQCWAERTWRKEDLQIYMFRLYLEYARLVSPDRDTGKMDFVMQEWHRDKPTNGDNSGNGVKDMEAMPGIDQ